MSKAHPRVTPIRTGSDTLVVRPDTVWVTVDIVDEADTGAQVIRRIKAIAHTLTQAAGDTPVRWGRTHVRNQSTKSMLGRSTRATGSLSLAFAHPLKSDDDIWTRWERAESLRDALNSAADPETTHIGTATWSVEHLDSTIQDAIARIAQQATAQAKATGLHLETLEISSGATVEIYGPMEATIQVVAMTRLSKGA